MNETKTYLLVLDFETTGTDAQRDYILESCCELLDNETLETVAFDETLYSVAPSVLSNLTAAVRDMHTENGLIAELLQHPTCGSSLAYAEDYILGMIRCYADDNKVLLTGNTIHFDRSFIAHWMPRLDARLHHNHVDVSAARRALGIPDNNKKAHRARADVEASIAVLRKLRSIGADFVKSGGVL